jgi:transposase InsO family protein
MALGMPSLKTCGGSGIGWASLPATRRAVQAAMAASRMSSTAAADPADSRSSSRTIPASASRRRRWIAPAQVRLLSDSGRPARVAKLTSGALASVGSTGDSYDNALAESTIGQIKTELIHRRGPWRTVEQLEFALFEYLDWWNHRRQVVLNDNT